MKELVTRCYAGGGNRGDEEALLFYVFLKTETRNYVNPKCLFLLSIPALCHSVISFALLMLLLLFAVVKVLFVLYILVFIICFPRLLLFSPIILRSPRSFFLHYKHCCYYCSLYFYYYPYQYQYFSKHAPCSVSTCITYSSFSARGDAMFIRHHCQCVGSRRFNSVE